MAQTPVFLAKGSYRQRRLRDAVRLLPILAAVFWLIPLLWPRGEAGPGNGTALIYIFVVWFALVIIGAALVARLDLSGDAEGQEQG